MNLYLGIFGMNLLNQVKQATSEYMLIKDQKKIVSYISPLIGKLQMSLEVLFNVIYTQVDKDVIFEKKIYYILLLELVKTLCKFKELKELKENGVHNYIDKSLYFSEFLTLNESDFMNKIKNQKNNSKDGKITVNEDYAIDKSINSNNGLFKIQNEKSTNIFASNTNTNINNDTVISVPEKIQLLINKKLNEEKEKEKESNNDNELSIYKKNSTCLYKCTNQCKHNINLKDNTNSFQKQSFSSFLEFLKSLINSKNSLIESLYLIKPLIYLISIKVFGRKSFYNLIIIIILDYLSLKQKDSSYVSDSSIVTNESKFDKESFSQKYLFNIEYKRRISVLIGCYLIRQPIADKLICPLISKILRLFRVPESFINVIVDFISNMYLSYMISS